MTRKTYACDGRQVAGDGAKGDEFHYSFSQEGDLELIAILRKGEVVETKKCDVGIDDSSETPNRKYGEYGELVEEKMLQPDGSAGYVVKYKHDEALKIIETAYFDLEGKSADGPGGWSVHTTQYLRESDGSGSRRVDRYFNRAGNPVEAGAERVAVEVFSFDVNGRCVKVEAYGVQNEKILCASGYHCARFDYDRFGYRSSESYFGTNDEPRVANLASDVSCHALHMVNDEIGNVLEATTCGTNGMPMNIPSRGYARESKKYDAKNRVIEWAFYDKDEKPVAPAKMSGAWCHRTIYHDTEAGGKEALSYQLNGNYMAVSLDKSGKRTKEAYFHADGTPRVDEEGVASIVYLYDDKGREIKREYFGIDDKRALTTELIAGIETIYSENGDEVESRRLGVDGELKLDRNGVAIVEMTYDENGNVLQGVVVDRNADGSIDNKDRYYYYSATAPWLFGLSSRLQYKNWDFGFGLRASLGNYLFNKNKLGYRSVEFIGSGTGYLSNTMPYSSEVNFRTSSKDYDALTDYFVENASFIKCDNITLGYSFENLFKGGNYNGLNGRIFATASNVFTITNYSGLDPEVGGGIDGGIYPRPISFVLGLSLNF